MQIAVHVLAYNVNRFIRPVLANMAPFVDKIYVAHPGRPWNYVEEARNAKFNPTRKEDISSVGQEHKVEIIEGDWPTEESMRNACFDQAKADGFDWLLIQDADEFYTEQSWAQIRACLQRGVAQDHLVTTWYNFWKSSQYVLMSSTGAIKQTNAGFAVRCRPDIKFVRKRTTNASNSMVIDCPCHHYGYVMSDAEMFEKLSTWGHARDFKAAQWFRYKWMNWRESSQYLHPTHPREWRRAIRFPLQQPDFAEQFSLPIKSAQTISAADAIGEVWFNASINARYVARHGKQAALSVIEATKFRK